VLGGVQSPEQAIKCFEDSRTGCSRETLAAGEWVSTRRSLFFLLTRILCRGGSVHKESQRGLACEKQTSPSLRSLFFLLTRILCRGSTVHKELSRQWIQRPKTSWFLVVSSWFLVVSSGTWVFLDVFGHVEGPIGTTRLTRKLEKIGPEFIFFIWCPRYVLPYRELLGIWSRRYLLYSMLQ